MTPERRAELTALRRARDLMDREFASGLDVAAVARHAHMSAAHFSRRFRAAYGESPHSYLMTRRIERAMLLLRQGTSVTDVCLAVGYSSLGSFSTAFTTIAGESPSAYRARPHSPFEEMPGCVARAVARPTRLPRPPSA
ncbi:helix-turn-helix transcriptional regulator [Schumannella sp. 10F1B-5-1]|uniref:helix-turn-helix transcriptional regulator n=1 Tax=Schumannella sp. 10F1B-5-1 TaxID=2590780 RepID=UPI002104BFC7|nr:helix-turn-helix transcriptional regulator [Schumannella sp. 10F1B-5-1]